MVKLYPADYITISRILLAAVFIYVAQTNSKLAAAIFFIAMVSDTLDGYVARKMKRSSNVGIILDAIADRFLVVAALFVLIVYYNFPIWIALLLILRDIVSMIGGPFVIKREGMKRIYASNASRITTVVLFLTFTILIYVEGNINPLTKVLLTLGVILNIVTIGEFAYRIFK